MIDGAAFIHEPLGEPDDEIRLLTVTSSLTEDEHLLSLNLTKWKLRDAPAYSAISYAWGEEVLRNAIVNGRPLLVHQTAIYALAQANLHFPSARFWIDALCINQHDAAEKSLQVQMMGQIYAQADRVLACVGQPGDDSEWLAAICHTLEHLDLSWHFYAGHDTRAIWNSWGSALHEDGLAVRLSDAATDFANREYWFRLWIVQELAAADYKIELLCGRDKISWPSIGLLANVLNEVIPDTQASGSMWVVRESVLLKPLSLADAFEEYHLALCADPRDRLFGLTSLIDWEHVPLGPILPDYALSRWELALETAPRLPVASLGFMLAAFRIQAESDEMLEAAFRRASSSSRMVRFKQSSPSSARANHQMVLSLSQGSARSTVIVQIGSDSSGNLSAALERDPVSKWQSSQRGNSERRASSAGNSREELKSIYTDDNGRVAALTCKETLPGDILVSQPHSFYSGLMLVLRHNHGNYCDVVGQAVLLNGFRLATLASRSRRVSRCDVSLNITAEDALVLAGQDMCRDAHDFYSQDGRLARLRTCPVLEPKACVQVVAVSS